MNETRNSGRDIAVLIAGVAAGVLGSRLLPPLIAAAAGSARASKSGDPFDVLVADHQQILSLLDGMTTHHGGSAVRRASLFMMLKRKLGKHALAEEDVVYPILHRDANELSESKDLYDEHADMKILLFELEERLMSGADWSEPVRTLRDLIQSHIEEEEQIVFPRLREMMNQDRRAKVSGQISREEALIL
jgi:hemerythrin superfamily protein